MHENSLQIYSDNELNEKLLWIKPDQIIEQNLIQFNQLKKLYGSQQEDYIYLQD